MQNLVPERVPPVRPRRGWLAAVVALLLAPGLSQAAGIVTAAPQFGADLTARQTICRMVDDAAATNRLPAGFLARVLWQESRFHREATSRAGAAGIAQFMPETAAERGLADPRDPGPAIAQAARLLADLAARFGNLGLAAAGYNAGAGRVERWLGAQSALPAETRLYVAAVTGQPVEVWARRGGALAGWPIDGGSCLATMADIARSSPSPAARPAWQARLDGTLAGAVRLLSALSPDRRSIGRPPLQAAQGLCDSLRSLGARCAVYQP